MDEKKKILLNSTELFGETNRDLFIEINLESSFSEIPKERYLNEFDFQKQFNDERNNSKNFIVYGIVDSNIIDTDDLTIKVYSDESFSQLIKNVKTTSLGYDQKNVFGKKRGKYQIELEGYGFDKAYLIIQSNNQSFVSQVYELTLVYRDSSGNVVPYGQQTSIVGLSGTEEVNNDFYFLYNKHWIERDLNIVEAQKRYVYFEQDVYTTNEGDFVNVVIRLNEPSIFGNESVDVVLNTPPGFSDITAIGDDNPLNPDYSITNMLSSSFPISLNWSAGETIKTLVFSGLTDNLIENLSEEIEIELVNSQNSVLDENIYNTKALVRFRDTTDRFVTKYNFQKIFKNISPLTKDWGSMAILPILTDLQNGYPNHYSNEYPNNKNYRFFPNDSFELTITNEGSSTVLPQIPGYTIGGDYFPAGSSKTFVINQEYDNSSNLSTETLTLGFNEEKILNPQTNERGRIIINGWRLPLDANFGGSGSGYPLDADTFWDIVKDDTFYSNYNLEMPFYANRIDDVTIELTAINPTVNINVTIPDTYVLPNNPNPLGGVSGQTYSGGDAGLSGRTNNVLEQIPFVLDLYGNTNNNLESRYSFEINKPGYLSLNIPSENLPTGALGSYSEYYLASSLGGQVKGPDLTLSSSTLSCNSGDLVSGDFYLQPNGFFLNGAALLANSMAGATTLELENKTTYEHNVSTNFVPKFLPQPIQGATSCDGELEISLTL